MNIALVVLLLGTFLAWANGANDVSKGIATLVGSGVTDTRRAIRWGTAWTAAGGLAGALVAGAMVSTFGKGFLAEGTAPTLSAALATIVGAALWVLLATRVGLPVSTTHAIVGALLGTALLAHGSQGIRWSSIADKVLLPLALSPVVALVLTKLGLPRLRRAMGGGARGDRLECVCIDAPAALEVDAAGGAAAQARGLPGLRVTTGSSDLCARTSPNAIAVTIPKLHWLTSGATSFARGANDAPKMAALMGAVGAVSPSGTVPSLPAFAAIAAGMAAGSWFAGRRVTEVLGTRVTPLDHASGFGANLVTSLLVSAGAVLGWPMSTTHVSSGAIVGAAAEQRTGMLDRRTLRDMILAWVATLPGAALLSGVAYLILRTFL